MTHGLKDAHREAIIAVIAANERVERAVLFGSRATGTNTVTSDVDIALFGDRLTLTDQVRLAAAVEEIPMAQSVDLLLYNSISDRTLREHIHTQGVDLYWSRRSSRQQTRSPHIVSEPNIREGWTEKPLGQVIELKRGYDLPARKRLPGPVPVVSSSGITGAHRESKVPGPGVVTGRYGTLGKVYFILDDFWPLNTTLYVRDFKENDPRFVSYLLRGLDFSGHSDKAAVPGLNRNHMHEEPVCVPADVGEQRAIAHILGTLDDKIELNRLMNETLEGMARALFKSWFVDFDPVRAKMEDRDTGLPQGIADLFPERLVDSEIGEIPHGWEVSEIGKEVHAVGGSTPSTKEPSYWHEGQRYWATPKDLSKLWSPVLLETSRKITDAGVQRISSGTLPVGTVLMSSRAPIGYLAIAEVPTAVNQGFIAMRCEQRLPNLYVLFWCYHNLGHIRDIAGGSTFAEISKRAFRPVSVLVPSESILQVYERLSRPLYDRLVVNMKEAVTLAALRDTLLPKLISGEIRVGDAEALEPVT